MKTNKSSSSRQVQIRYATDYFSNALYDTYSNTETAMREMITFRERCVANGQHRIAESIRLA